MECYRYLFHNPPQAHLGSHQIQAVRPCHPRPRYSLYCKRCWSQQSDRPPATSGSPSIHQLLCSLCERHLALGKAKGILSRIVPPEFEEDEDLSCTDSGATSGSPVSLLMAKPPCHKFRKGRPSRDGLR